MKFAATALFTLFLGTTALAEPLAVFGVSDSRRVDTDPAPGDPAQAAFFRDYRGDRDGDAPLEAGLPLVNPPAWGKTVSSQSGGMVRFHRRFPRGFACHLELHDLAPNHAYLLTLNGNPQKAGNDLLPTPVPGNEREKYYDFLDIKTDASGRYVADLGIFLQRGRYDVRLYVKDAADFKIILYRDFFRFAVD
ncbi:MAG TPA: hypothetical protein VG710_05685 [Opitutus sp.]|nr:hypothetical protein [Opitutus sp.]